MDKRRRNNGFTLLETLIVIGLLSVCFLLTVGLCQPPLMIFMKQLENHLLVIQQNAFIHKQTIPVQIGQQAALFDQEYMSYPLSVSCQAQVLSFNENGAPNHAQTITCTNGIQRKKLIIQLGSGRMRIE